MTDLTTFRDHARAMASAKHRPDCRAEDPWGLRYIVRPWEYPDPRCPGCVTDADRELWTALAVQVDAYLAGDLTETLDHADDVPLFGGGS